ncbi:SPOR domain-containing protein [Pseudophaeobacter flagellatus]|uniref:SPOR domain-containing protein n=1 Tax=Pseudophaeobacter flagellatus TaxID=2899119 RepID=UPI001E3F924B|nr:SPOR domain-containing protein [Pseudophaeobacter flagellatus]MCD9147477.1 SPOR domain-containing protein [Pseudophaeobacter flagellatus]
MKLTRIIALAIISGTIALAVEDTALQAQTLRAVRPPAEFPPASFHGKQFVDSRGCVYIRAGIDGNVNWVPRVARNRKQLCGYKPTTVAGATARPTQSAGPEMITLDAPAKPAPQTAAAATPVAKPVPKPRTAAATPPAVVTTAKPRRTPQTTTARVTAAPRPATTAVRPAPTRTRPAASTGSVNAQARGQAGDQAGCAGVSAISRQYSGKAGTRCGPQAQSPVTYGSGSGIGPQSSLVLSPNTRVLPVHVYEQRRHSLGMTPPPGYTAAWDDDRLNLRRAERDLRPAILTGRTQVPEGYVAVKRRDDRMNPMRGVRTPRGDAQMAAIWDAGPPRSLRALPLDRPVVKIDNRRHDNFEGEDRHGLALRLSSRSAPGATDTPAVTAASAPARYVRAATFADAAQARQAAQALAATGLPVRLGALSRKGVPYKVVLAGPFHDSTRAEQALNRVRAAGYRGARLSR